MDFSCALAVGNVDRARKFVAAAVRRRPALWESAARACVAAGRADVAGLCLSRAGHARGAAAVREAAAEADGDDDDTIGPPRAAPSETCCRCWCRPTWTRRTTGRASTPLGALRLRAPALSASARRPTTPGRLPPPVAPSTLRRDVLVPLVVSSPLCSEVAPVGGLVALCSDVAKYLYNDLLCSDVAKYLYNDLIR